MQPSTQPQARAVLRDSTGQDDALGDHLLIGACRQARRDEGHPPGELLGVYGESLERLRYLARDDAAQRRASRGGWMLRAAQARRDTRLSAATVTVHADGTTTVTDPFGVLPYVHDEAA